MERQFGPYRLVRQVAVGGMAEIHLARARGIAGFEKYVALKMIHPNFAADEQFIDMLVDEAKIAVQLTHHNIAHTFDLGRVGDTYYISMEYVDGADLYKVLRRASEQDLEFSLDVCAFVAKEVLLGLDYAHRKRDVTGTPLGIVHRDVSPQNVLVSYAGEVKLVDFGIAKATMKARQTAAGVIKGKYYYMSPEQATGGNVDARADIFSAGIVLYEMITGQMLYLEEDLHRLLDMVRRANIAPPSTLRRGIPPQLERIVMHALAKAPADRYQSGADMASDLERFLHAYSPVFTPSKLVALLRQSVGEPMLTTERPETIDSVIPLDDSELMREPGEVRDSNSVLFRIKPRPLHDFSPIDTNAGTDSGQNPVGEIQNASPIPSPAPEGKIRQRIEPAIDSKKPAIKRPDTRKPVHNNGIRRLPTSPPAVLPSLPKLRPPTAPLPALDLIPRRNPAQTTRPISHSHAAAPEPTSTRSRYDDTRELPHDLEEDSLASSDLLTPEPSPPAKRAPVMPMYGTEDLEGGDSTMVNSIPNFFTETDEIENTMVQSEIPIPEYSDRGEPRSSARAIGVRPASKAATGAATGAAPDDSDDDDGPTISADIQAGPGAGRRLSGAPAALAARNPTPAVSELRRPRVSRSTPAGGVANILQAIVAAPGNEPMPTAGRARPPSAPISQPVALEATMVAAPMTHETGNTPSTTPDYGAHSHAYSQPEHPGVQPGQPHPHSLPQQYGYPYVQAPYPPQATPGTPMMPDGSMAMYPSGQPQYGFGGYPMLQGGPHVSTTGQQRALELDEVLSQYRIRRQGPRWFVLLGIAMTAVATAATVTFLVLRFNRQAAFASAALNFSSNPPGASIFVNNKRLADLTPAIYRQVKPGGRYQVRIEREKYQPYLDQVVISSSGGEVTINATLKQIVGKLDIVSKPPGATVFINRRPMGTTPLTISDIDMDNTRAVTISLAKHDPHIESLNWTSTAELHIDVTLTPAGRTTP